MFIPHKNMDKNFDEFLKMHWVILFGHITFRLVRSLKSWKCTSLRVPYNQQQNGLSQLFSFVDITSNQAQPLSNFLLIQPDQRHLQILIEVQLEDYSPPPLPNPPNLANEGGRTLLYQQGTRPSAVWTWVTKINTSRLLELC